MRPLRKDGLEMPVCWRDREYDKAVAKILFNGPDIRCEGAEQVDQLFGPELLKNKKPASTGPLCRLGGQQISAAAPSKYPIASPSCQRSWRLA